jgi:hypothetical protein
VEVFSRRILQNNRIQKAGRTLLIIIAGVIFFGQRWYTYVTIKTRAYDEVGIQLTSAMPSPIRKWGCDKLHATQSDDRKSWM